MAKLIVVAALLLLLFLLWRRWGRQRRAAFIERYRYARILDARLAVKRPELGEEQRAEVFLGLGDYFQLCRMARGDMVAMPSQVVDDAWHEFILFTRYYERFCRLAFGRFLHHTPAEAMAGPTHATDGIKRAWRLACRREKIDPENPDRLPRIFAMDAALGIAGGFIYHLDCLSAPQGDGYCASHIGCSGSKGGGGCGGGCSSDSGGDGCGGGGGCGGD